MHVNAFISLFLSVVHLATSILFYIYIYLQWPKESLIGFAQMYLYSMCYCVNCQVYISSVN